MYSIVRNIKSTFAVVSALLLTVITTKVRGSVNCRAEELMQCSKPLSVLESGLNFVSSKADLEKICPDFHNAIRCIHQHTRFCMNLHQRKHFKKLFHGTADMVNNLCRNETFQEVFLKHAPCMQMVQAENEICFKKYTANMQEIQARTPIDNISEDDLIAFNSYQKKKRDAADEGIKNVCCALQEYVKCSTSTTRDVCGNETAEFTKMFLDKMSSSMIQVYCQNYGHRECGFSAPSSANNNHRQILSSHLTMFSVLFLSLIGSLLSKFSM